MMHNTQFQVPLAVQKILDMEVDKNILDAIVVKELRKRGLKRPAGEDDFAGEVAKLKEEETTSVKQFEALAAATEEIKAGTKQIETKEEKESGSSFVHSEQSVPLAVQKILDMEVDKNILDTIVVKELRKRGLKRQAGEAEDAPPSTKEQLESEAKADEETYDKFKWCHENTVAKEQAAEVEKTEDEVAKNQEYTSDLKRLNADLEGVASALTTLGNAEGTAFLQSREGAGKPLRAILAKHSEKLSQEDRETIEAFLQRGDGVDGVMGVLTGLKDDFAGEVAKLKEEETTSVKQFEASAAAKTEEIKAGTKQIETKEEKESGSSFVHSEQSVPLAVKKILDMDVDKSILDTIVVKELRKRGLKHPAGEESGSSFVQLSEQSVPLAVQKILDMDVDKSILDTIVVKELRKRGLKRPAGEADHEKLIAAKPCEIDAAKAEDAPPSTKVVKLLQGMQEQLESEETVKAYIPTPCTALTKGALFPMVSAGDPGRQ